MWMRAGIYTACLYLCRRLSVSFYGTLLFRKVSIFGSIGNSIAVSSGTDSTFTLVRNDVDGHSMACRAALQR
ncbi:hypothetical protein DF147_00055 [Burkholderia cenocepacia]|nr:hypothetical protein DF147_00055 [Burkholderia cenocepacia]RQV55827.1 hypothetical protein DF024_30160 [Burkholderia cenocepacia]RQV91463.1 hypothetical protein DF019_00055 [Burkholderia cenocepacia]